MTGRFSPLTELGVMVASPLMALVGVYLLFAGHNQPGGGFAAGLVFGTVVAVRTVAGVQQPRYATELISGGLIIIVLVALGPVLFGDTFLDQKVVSVDVPLVGKVKSGSALPFDVGVTLVVVGLVIAVLDGLGVDELLVKEKRPEGGAQQ